MAVATTKVRHATTNTVDRGVTARSQLRSARVMHVITPSRLAGAETLLARMAPRLAQRDILISVLAAGPQNVLDELRQRGVDSQSVPIRGKFNPLALRALSRSVRNNQADILHSHLSTASWWCGWLEAIGGPPSVGHVHGFTSAMWHRRQSRLIAVSHAVKQHLIERQIAPERVCVIHNPIDPQDVAPRRPTDAIRDELTTDREAPVVGAFAHLSEKKGWRELVEAAADVVAAIPSAVFWFVGDGPLRDELRGRAASLGIAHAIRMAGFRGDVADVMHAIDVMALPSHREPFGLVYAEAGLLEKPVIACSSGGTPEVVLHNETGLLVPPHDAPSLASAIITLLQDNSLAATLGRRGREHILDRFGWNRFLDGVLDVYDQLDGA